MSASPTLVLDGGGIACLGLARRDGARLADLRKPLAVACGLARRDLAFRCYLDRNLPYRVRAEDRGLLDLLLAEHGEAFAAIPPSAEAEDYLLGRAGSGGATLVSAGLSRPAASYLHRYPWLAEPRRLAIVTESEGILRCGDLLEADSASPSAFDLYDELLLAL